MRLPRPQHIQAAQETAKDIITLRGEARPTAEERKGFPLESRDVLPEKGIEESVPSHPRHIAPLLIARDALKERGECKCRTCTPPLPWRERGLGGDGVRTPSILLIQYHRHLSNSQHPTLQSRRHARPNA
jgi:hypothetical protein